MNVPEWINLGDYYLNQGLRGPKTAPCSATVGIPRGRGPVILSFVTPPAWVFEITASFECAYSSFLERFRRLRSVLDINPEWSQLGRFTRVVVLKG